MKVLIIASGGGHTGYAVAVAQYLYGKARIDVVIPKGDSWSRELVKPYADKIIEIPKPRMPSESIYKAFTGMPWAFISSIRNIGKYDVAVATGSNHSLAPAVVAKLRGAKLVAIESHDRFLSKGKTVSILEKMGATIAIHWDLQLDLYPNGIVCKPIVRKPKYKPRNEGYVVVIGGFCGHELLYDAFSKLDIRKAVIQTGRVNPEKYRRPGWRVFQFDKDLEWWISRADVVVGHNSTTILEASINYRKPVVIVPNPRWKASASPEEALILAQLLNGEYVDEITPRNLARAIENARKRQPPRWYRNGAEELAKIIIDICRLKD